MKFVKYFLATWVLSFGYSAAFAQADFWQQTNGPDGGTVNMIAVNKANGYVFAVINGVGMIRSTDNGVSWVLKNSGLGSASVQAIVVNASGVIFVGTNGQGVFRSTDHGESWLQINTGIATTHRNIRALAVDSCNAVLFAGTSSSGLYRSRDNGNTWTALSTGLTGAVTFQAFAIKCGNRVVFAGTDTRGTLRSNNNGDTWTPIDTSSIYKNVRALVVTASGAVFAGADSASTKRAILRSTNNGDNWTQVLTPSDNVVWFALNSHDHIWAGTAGSGIYVSSNNGGNWLLRNNGLRGYSIKTIALNASDHIFAGAHCSGIFRSIDNGASWQAMNNGLQYTEILSLAASPVTGTIVAGSHCGGVFRSNDNGNNWVWAGLPGAQVTALTVNANGRFFAGVARIYLLETSGDIYYADDGITWRGVTPDDDAYFSFAINSAGHIYAGTGFYQACGIFCVADYGDIYRSMNNGSSWSRVASKLDDWVYALAVDPSGRVFAGTGEGVYRSRGEFWDKLNPYNTRSLIIYPLDPNIILDGTSGGIWRSPDGGDNWTMVRSMPNNFTWALVALPTGEIFAGTQTSGVLKSTDAGVTWTPVNTGLTNMNVRSLALHHSSRQIFAGTNGRGIFRHVEPATGTAPTVTTDAAANIAATSAVLNGTVNPNGRSTMIKFEYGTTAGYGDTIAATPSPVNGTNAVSVSAAATRLAPNTTYHFRIVATNSAGTANGADRTFTTSVDTAGIKPIVAATQRLGAEFWVDIEINNGQNLFGASFDLNYNTAHIDALQAEAGPFLGNDLVFLPAIDDLAGKVSIGISRKAGQGGVNGSGVIARVKFKSLASTPSGIQVFFCVNQVSANDPAGNTIFLAASCDTTAIQGLLVWPGDTNDDGTVNAVDVLRIGIHWSKTAPARQNGSCNWVGQPAMPWTPVQATYADANGDGKVDAADVLCIGLNWGKTHNAAALALRKNNLAKVQSQSNAGTLCYIITGNPSPGQEFYVDVQALNVTNLFGASFELIYSPTADFDPQTTEAGSFMGSDVIFFPNVDKSMGKISIGISQKAPQTGVIGSGVVARIRMKMAASAPANQIVNLALQNVAANDPAGGSLEITPSGNCTTTGVEEFTRFASAPNSFALYAPSPNPFNPSTTIKYDLPQQVDVKFMIFDVMGRHVRTLVDQTQQAGRYAVIWDGRNEQGQPVASGTFLYRLQAGNFMKTLRMALVR